MVAGTSGSDTFWVVGDFPGIGNTKYLRLDTNDGESTATVAWNDTSPTNSAVTFGSSNVLNDGGYAHIMYSWHSVPGYSAFGSFESNSSGVFVYLGFKPALIISKYADGTGHWNMYDNQRQPFNTGQATVLYPDLPNQESTGTVYNFEFLSNGFRSFGTGSSYNSGTHLYMAWAEAPVNFSNAR